MPVWIQSVEMLRTRKKLPGRAFDWLPNLPLLLAEAARESHENEVAIGSGCPTASQACFRQKHAKPAHHAHGFLRCRPCTGAPTAPCSGRRFPEGAEPDAAEHTPRPCHPANGPWLGSVSGPLSWVGSAGRMS